MSACAFAWSLNRWSWEWLCKPQKKDTTISLSVCSACRCISTKWVMMDLSSSNAMGAVPNRAPPPCWESICVSWSNIHVCAQQSVLLKETTASNMEKFDDSKSRPRPASIACGFGHLNMAHARGRLTYTISITTRVCRYLRGRTTGGTRFLRLLRCGCRVLDLLHA